MRIFLRSASARSSPALPLLAFFLFFGLCCSGGALIVGPIYVTGSGSFSTELIQGLFPGVAVEASGSNGTDSVSFGGSVQQLLGLPVPVPVVGSGFGFSGSPVACTDGPQLGGDTCFVNIDGIGGFGVIDFVTPLGGSVSVYSIEGSYPFAYQVGPLLAQASFIGTTTVTSVNDFGDGYSGTFAISLPEPGTGAIALIGAFGILAVSQLRRTYRGRCGPRI
jgi:hypothetical protein